MLSDGASQKYAFFEGRFFFMWLNNLVIFAKVNVAGENPSTYATLFLLKPCLVM